MLFVPHRHPTITVCYRVTVTARYQVECLLLKHISHFIRCSQRTLKNLVTITACKLGDDQR
jgi:hypothetical protein